MKIRYGDKTIQDLQIKNEFNWKVKDISSFNLAELLNFKPI